MGFFKFGPREVSVLPGSDKEPFNYYSFMEINDLVYYFAPGSNHGVLASIENYTTDQYGRPEVIYLKFKDGTEIETTVHHIKY